MLASSRRSRTLSLAAAIGLIAALAVGLIAQGAGDPTTAHAKKKKKADPNVVVFLTDDMDSSQMRIMDEVKSEIGERGVTFANSFTNWPLCCPSRATLLTGQYAQNHNVRGNSANTGGGFANFNNNNTLALWLQDAGYTTVQIGKFLNGYGGTGSGPAFVPPGWSEWYAGTDGTTQQVYNYTLNENGNLVDYGDDVDEFKQDVFTDLAVDVIDRRAPQKRPFFIQLAYTASHGGGPNPNPNPPTDCGGTAKPAPRHADVFDSEPLPQPPNFNEADVSDKPEGIRNNPPLNAGDIADITRNYRCRLGSLLSVDEGVGRVMDALRASGELKNTLVIFTSDNGFFHGEHRVKAGKNRLYEPSIRVPYLMRGPGVPKSGKTVRDLIINADTAPTIVDAANARARLQMDGRSLFRAAKRPGKVSGRTMMIDTLGYKAVRTQRYIYAEHDTGEIEMYDLQADPFELESVHADPAYSKARSRLAQLLDEFRGCSGRECARGPRVKLKLKPKKLPGQGCRPPRLKATLTGGEKRAVEEATFRGAGKRDRDRHKPFRFNVNAAGKGKVKIKATIELRDGRVDSTLKRKTKVC